VLAVAEGSTDGHSVGHSTTRHAAGRRRMHTEALWGRSIAHQSLSR
jgi:hypothetical protein